MSNIWFIYICTSLFICTHYMHMYRLVLMIFSFTLVLPIYIFISCICYFCSKLINIHVYPLSHLSSCNLYYGLFLYLGYVCILLVLDKNIHIPRSLFLDEKWIFRIFIFIWKMNFHVFHMIDWFWALLLKFMKMLLTWLWYTHISFVYLWHCFHEIFWPLYISSVNSCVF